jgi:metal-responsive CopG/Arc/MetJ family transcriptional regulator
MNRPKSERLVLQAPSPVVEAIDKVANRKFVSRSHYIRTAVLEALQRDGVQPIAA